MKKHLIAVLLLCLTSCATITNSKTYALRVNTNAQNASAKVYDSVYKLPADVEVTRSNKPLQVTLTYDTITRDYNVKSKTMSKSSVGNILFGGLYPEALLVDLLTKKGYYYGDEIFLDISDSLAEAKRIFLTPKYVPNQKNSFNIDIALPYVNGFLFQPEGQGVRKGIGFIGISGGVEYFYKNNKFAKINTGITTNYPFPFPAAVIFDGGREIFNSYYVTFTDNYQLNRFSLGYGLSYSSYKWKYNYGDDNYNNEKNKREKGQSLGLSLNTYFRLGRYFQVGVLYTPTLVSIKPQTELLYQHSISFELLWKIQIKK